MRHVVFTFICWDIASFPQCAGQQTAVFTMLGALVNEAALGSPHISRFLDFISRCLQLADIDTLFLSIFHTQGKLFFFARVRFLAEKNRQKPPFSSIETPRQLGAHRRRRLQPPAARAYSGPWFTFSPIRHTMSTMTLRRTLPKHAKMLRRRRQVRRQHARKRSQPPCAPTIHEISQRSFPLAHLLPRRHAHESTIVFRRICLFFASTTIMPTHIRLQGSG